MGRHMIYYEKIVVGRTFGQDSTLDEPILLRLLKKVSP